MREVKGGRIILNLKIQKPTPTPPNQKTTPPKDHHQAYHQPLYQTTMLTKQPIRITPKPALPKPTPLVYHDTDAHTTVLLYFSSEKHELEIRSKSKKKPTANVVPREENAESLMSSAFECYMCKKSFSKMHDLMGHYAWKHFKANVLKSKPRCTKGTKKLIKFRFKKLKRTETITVGLQIPNIQLREPFG